MSRLKTAKKKCKELPKSVIGVMGLSDTKKEQVLRPKHKGWQL